MPRPRMPFTVRTLAVVIALIALNLAAVITSWRWYLRSLDPPERDRLGPLITLPRGPDGAIHLAVARMKTGEALERVIWPVPRPSLLQISSPVIASLSVTLLVLAAPRTRLAPRDQPAPEAAGPSERPSPTRWGVGLWVTIAAALIGLNLAGAAYQPLPESADEWEKPRLWLSYYADTNNLRKPSYSLEQGQLTIVWSDGRATRLEPGDAEGHILETIVCKPDGAIVYYEGNPGLLRRLFTWPQVMREPSRSMLEMWWPVLAAALVTSFVLRTFWTRWRLIGTLPRTGSARMEIRRVGGREAVPEQRHPLEATGRVSPGS